MFLSTHGVKTTSILLLYKTTMMTFTQKIYYNNKPLLLTNNKETITANPHYKLLEGASSIQFSQALQLLEQSNTKGVLILGEKEQLEKELLWNFYSLHSAGGVVLNEAKDVLMIFRRGKWDLPKGKQDDGENIEQCAVREVQEETGIQNVEIIEKIGNTLHIYPMAGRLILKHTAWFLMNGSAQEKLLPQEEEQIDKVEWVKSSDIAPLLHNSFETISDILKKAAII